LPSCGVTAQLLGPEKLQLWVCCPSLRTHSLVGHFRTWKLESNDFVQESWCTYPDQTFIQLITSGLIRSLLICSWLNEQGNPWPFSGIANYTLTLKVGTIRLKLLHSRTTCFCGLPPWFPGEHSRISWVRVRNEVLQAVQRAACVYARRNQRGGMPTDTVARPQVHMCCGSVRTLTFDPVPPPPGVGGWRNSPLSNPSAHVPVIVTVCSHS
jgi:hypothetical protein